MCELWIKKNCPKYWSFCMLSYSINFLWVFQFSKGYSDIHTKHESSVFCGTAVCLIEMAVRSYFYLIYPVGFRDWDVVTTEMSEATAIVEDGGEVREVAVQIEILCVGPTAGPPIVLMTLNITNLISQKPWTNLNRVSKRVTRYLKGSCYAFSLFEF